MPIRDLQNELTLSGNQRLCLGIILLMVFAWAGWYAWTHPVFVANPPSPDAPRGAELADRIDPNTCDAIELASLPGVGESRARDIIAYREKSQKRDPSEPVFRTREDLLKINGVGRAMMLQLEPFLVFPKGPTTAPAIAPNP